MKNANSLSLRLCLLPYRRQRHVVVITQKCFSDRWDQSLRDTRARIGISAVVRLITWVLSWCHRVASRVILYVALWHCFCRSESEGSWYEAALTEQSPQLLGKTQTLTFFSKSHTQKHSFRKWRFGSMQHRLWARMRPFPQSMTSLAVGAGQALTKLLLNINIECLK